MTEEPSQRRLAENEVVFRTHNEKLQKGIQDTNRLALQDHQPEYLISVGPNSPPLRFYCECSDENCSQRVLISFQDYTRVHKKRDCFMIKPGHEVPQIEHIVLKREPEYHVVQKYVKPPETASILHPTNTNNS